MYENIILKNKIESNNTNLILLNIIFLSNDDILVISVPRVFVAVHTQYTICNE